FRNYLFEAEKRIKHIQFLAAGYNLNMDKSVCGNHSVKPKKKRCFPYLDYFLLTKLLLWTRTPGNPPRCMCHQFEQNVRTPKKNYFVRMSRSRHIDRSGRPKCLNFNTYLPRNAKKF